MYYYGNMKKGQLINSIKNNTLARELSFILLAALLIFGVAFFVSTVVITNEARKDSEIRESETVINSVAGSINASIDNYKDISRLIMLNDKVNAFLRASDVDSGLINDAKYGVMDVLNVSKNLDSVFILRNDGAYMSTGRAEYNVSFSMMDTEFWYTPILEKRGGAVILIDAGGAIHRKNGNSVITIARAIYDIYTQERTGILLMNISTKMLDKLVTVGNGTTLCILDESGNYLAGDEELVSYFPGISKSGVIENREYKSGHSWKMISSYRFKDVPLVIMCSTKSSMTSIPHTSYIVLITLLIIFFMAMFASGYFVTSKINKPIYALTKAMEKTKARELGEARELSEASGLIEKIDLDVPDNEIGSLLDSYNSMIDYLNAMITRLLENEKTIQRAEMRVLQEQIKPHFLYNSLGTISYMAFEAGAEDVYSALEKLGSFYRNFLSKGDREIYVKQEITIIKDYLSLQKLRYGDILEDEYDISDEILELKVPKLILQPIIENCIYHGIRPKGEPGLIKISGYLKDSNIVLSVYDTGVGMSAEVIEKVLAGEAGELNDENSKSSGFGLKGTIDRIRYYCNKQDVVTIESVEGEYSLITISIPIEARRGEVPCTE